MKQIYFAPICVQTNDFSKEYVQKVLQEKIGTKGLEIEDIIDIQDPNEVFQHEYVFGDRKKATELLDYIDPNYDEGYFFIIAARNGDIDMLTALIEKGKEKNLDTTNSIQEGLIASANAEQKECVKMLVDNGANPKLLTGSSIYGYIKECIS